MAGGEGVQDVGEERDGFQRGGRPQPGPGVDCAAARARRRAPGRWSGRCRSAAGCSDRGGRPAPPSFVAETDLRSPFSPAAAAPCRPRIVCSGQLSGAPVADEERRRVQQVGDREGPLSRRRNQRRRDECLRRGSPPERRRPRTAIAPSPLSFGTGRGRRPRPAPPLPPRGPESAAGRSPRRPAPVGDPACAGVRREPRTSACPETGARDPRKHAAVAAPAGAAPRVPACAPSSSWAATDRHGRHAVQTRMPGCDRVARDCRSAG